MQKERMVKMAERLEDMPNIGKVVAEELRQVGIETPEQLRAVGSKEAFLRIKTIDSGACLHKLNGLEGAVQGVRKYNLPQATKDDLKRFFDSLNQPPASPCG